MDIPPRHEEARSSSHGSDSTTSRNDRAPGVCHRSRHDILLDEAVNQSLLPGPKIAYGAHRVQRGSRTRCRVCGGCDRFRHRVPIAADVAHGARAIGLRGGPGDWTNVGGLAESRRSRIGPRAQQALVSSSFQYGSRARKHDRRIRVVSIAYRPVEAVADDQEPG